MQLISSETHIWKDTNNIPLQIEKSIYRDPSIIFKHVYS